MDASVPALVIDQEGRWQLADSENKDSRKVSAKTDLSDTARNCNELYAGEIY
jgi:hypothetical protein